jgi:hypothetical protein
MITHASNVMTSIVILSLTDSMTNLLLWYLHKEARRTVFVFHGCFLVCSDWQLILKADFLHAVARTQKGVGPSQGLCLHITEKRGHACPERDSNMWSNFSTSPQDRKLFKPNGHWLDTFLEENPMWLWGHSLLKISSPGPLLYGTRWLPRRPYK